MIVFLVIVATLLVGVSFGRWLASGDKPEQCRYAGGLTGCFPCKGGADPMCIGHLCRRHCREFCGERCG